MGSFLQRNLLMCLLYLFKDTCYFLTYYFKNNCYTGRYWFLLITVHYPVFSNYISTKQRWQKCYYSSTWIKSQPANSDWIQHTVLTVLHLMNTHSNTTIFWILTNLSKSLLTQSHTWHKKKKKDKRTPTKPQTFLFFWHEKKYLQLFWILIEKTIEMIQKEFHTQ